MSTESKETPQTQQTAGGSEPDAARKRDADAEWFEETREYIRGYN